MQWLLWFLCINITHHGNHWVEMFTYEYLMKTAIVKTVADAPIIPGKMGYSRIYECVRLKVDFAVSLNVSCVSNSIPIT